jgi:hypothetical protein
MDSEMKWKDSKMMRYSRMLLWFSLLHFSYVVLLCLHAFLVFVFAAFLIRLHILF